MLNGRPAHQSMLMVIGIVAGLGLVLEANLKVSTTTHHILLLVWCAITYATLAGWVSTNRTKLHTLSTDKDDGMDSEQEWEVA